MIKEKNQNNKFLNNNKIIFLKRIKYNKTKMGFNSKYNKKQMK